MAKIKNNPYDILDKEDISKKLLSEKALISLGLYDKAKMLYEKRPASNEFKENVEKAGKITSEVIEKEVARIKNELKNETDESEKKEIKKAQSKKIIEKSENVMYDLEICRQKLKEDRKRKVESGEIKPPKKKTITTKLRQELVKTAGMIPKNLKGDTKIIQRTQKALLNFLSELKSIWGLNKIKPIQDELEAKFKKMEEGAAKG